MLARVVVLLAALACACFSDPPPVDESGTTGPGCSVGADMCPCTDGGACDAGLVCHGPLQLCYDPGCTPGEDGCTCDDDACGEGLRCNEGLCETRDDPTSVSTSATAEGGTSTGAADSTSVSDEGEVGTGTDTEPLDPCRTCIVSQATTCATQYVPCGTNPNCDEVAMCIVGGMDAGACCTGEGSDDDAWDAYVMCTLMECGDVCMNYALTCG